LLATLKAADVYWLVNMSNIKIQEIKMTLQQMKDLTSKVVVKNTKINKIPKMHTGIIEYQLGANIQTV
jgi:hypothetical protein